MSNTQCFPPLLLMSSSLRRMASVPAALLSSSLLFAEKAFAFGGAVPGSLPGGTNIRTVITQVLSTVLTYLALFAAIVIVIAGIRLIFSQGDETAKDEAKKAILYAVIGLLIILFAKAIVTFVTTLG